MTDTQHILDLHRANLPLRRIAGMHNLTTRQVVDLLQREGVLAKPPKPPRPRAKVDRPAKPVPRPAPRCKVNPVKAALQILGSRARDTDDGYFVDGRPVGSFELIRKANAVLKAGGMPQMDACEEWLVKD